MDPKTPFPGLSEYFTRILEVCMSHQVNYLLVTFMGYIKQPDYIFT